ncbi:DUF6448 family protein [Methanosarcina sp. UBA411]|uniref:DUF6448 family protein n=2 Tax=unclassified Methanosarcina TaxID=2644672 RepID=UPI0025F2B845|nr:DUF6448 family protein [Methanosarcina sp. UBA411]
MSRGGNAIRAYTMLFTAFLVILGIAVTTPVSAHCDTMDGPVVKAAQEALETGNVNLVLIWVPEKDEAQIKEAFNNTIAVRKLSPEAKKLADMYFFETLVRVHRAGEGAPYTGLKPAGLDMGPAIPAADEALETGSPDKLVKLLTDATENGTREEFSKVMEKKNFSADNVSAGREYVETYVPFIHYVERVYEAATAPAEGHYIEADNESGEIQIHAEETKMASAK